MSGMRESRIDGGTTAMNMEQLQRGLDRAEQRAEALEAEVAEWKRNFDFAVKHHYGLTLAAEAEVARLRDELRITQERGDGWRKRYDADTTEIRRLRARLEAAGFVMDREEVNLERRARVDEIEQHLEWEQEGTVPTTREELVRLGADAIGSEYDARAVLDAVLPAYNAMRDAEWEQVGDENGPWICDYHGGVDYCASMKPEGERIPVFYRLREREEEGGPM